MVGAESAALAPKVPAAVWKDAAWPDLIGRLAAGDPDALARLYDESCRLVYSIALRILADTADAEEVTLDVYTQVWQQARHYSADRGAVASWLIMLARSRAIDKMRSRGKRYQLEDPLPLAGIPNQGTDPEQDAALAQRRRVVRGALAQLSPEQRQVIELAYFGGLSHHEQASLLGLPLGTVKTRIRLGMTKLRELLGEVA